MVLYFGTESMGQSNISTNTKNQKLQNSAVRVITGAFSSSPSMALEVEAAILPTRVQHFKLANNYALRLLMLGEHHPIHYELFTNLKDELNTSTNIDFALLSFLPDTKSQINRLAGHLSRLTKCWRIEQVKASWSPPWLSSDINVSISKSDKDTSRKEHMELIKTIPYGDGIIYTDGSHAQNNTSSKCIVLYTPFTRQMVSLSYNLGRSMSICDAETYAILKEIKKTTTYGPDHSWHIFSDSQASLHRIGHTPNMICHQIRKECFRKNINLYWCPGHMNIEGNDLADNLAKFSRMECS
ncbi:hypothetical protein EV44_g3582 [Erysiphe necator]|uniref:RNase H type-1 domain-containing protein n=1 Tax=Uncinula necator TaxID=52586 RepID=A0A0B1NYY5_UNCNE|nr:hypothetical protein EV44_g3582 [Erysiphe necator]